MTTRPRKKKQDNVVVYIGEDDGDRMERAIFQVVKAAIDHVENNDEAITAMSCALGGSAVAYGVSLDDLLDEVRRHYEATRRYTESPKQ